MSAYKDALHLSSAEEGLRLKLAEELLTRGQAVVVLDGVLALHSQSDEVLCEVISSGSNTPEVQVERGRRLLRASTLGSALGRRKCRWLVVEDYGSGTVELWRES